MASSKFRSIVKGIGGLMSAIFVATASLYFTDWMKGHSSAVLAAMCISGIASIACFVFLLPMKDRASIPSQKVRGSGGTATAVGSIGDVGTGANLKIGGDIHYHQG